MQFTPLFIIIIIGLLAGVLSGLVGVGGGIVMVPLFVYMLGYSQHHAQGLSLAVMLPPVTLLAVINYNKTEQIDWKLAALTAVIFIIGSYFGSKIALNIDQVKLKKIFGFVMLIAALKIIFGK